MTIHIRSGRLSKAVAAVSLAGVMLSAGCQTTTTTTEPLILAVGSGAVRLAQSPENNAAPPRPQLEPHLAAPDATARTGEPVKAAAQVEVQAQLKGSVVEVPVERATTGFAIDAQELRVADEATVVEGSYPIDFPTALLLAGADNWNVKIARQRVREANAEYCQAKNAWLPSLTLSMGFNSHEGEIQATEGDVITVSRNSLFLGAGAGVANAPLNGGSGGPPRMFVDFSLADAIFKPLAARRELGAEQARRNRVFNDTMLQASLAYYDLVRTQMLLTIAQTNLSEATQLATLTDGFIRGGKGTPADASRVAVIVNQRRQRLIVAESDVKIASAKLATILQLDPSKLNPELGLIALDVDTVPLNLVDTNDLAMMITQAQTQRCEIIEANSLTCAAQSEAEAERWRPWLPNLYAGYSGGLFGGGTGSSLSGLDGRSDLDVVVSWQLKNLGYGSRAQQDATRSRVHQRNFEMKRIRDEVAQQVTTTWQRVTQYQRMLGILDHSVVEAGSGLEKNLKTIKALEGMPLEAIASLDQLATARTDYTNAVIDYNQWQLRLLRAAGQSLTSPVSGDCNGRCDGRTAVPVSHVACTCGGCGLVSDCPSCVRRP